VPVFQHFGDEYEQVVFGHDAGTGLRTIIALHSTALGPGLGGTRFKPYATEEEALVDVLRLARGMTYKHAAAGLPFGGGKAVIFGDPAAVRTDDLIRAYARQIDGLGGRYLTAEDVGTTQADMDLIAEVTPYVTGTTGGSGDPSPATAWGVFNAMQAAVGDDLAGRRVVVLGAGKVGAALVGHLVDGGAKVMVADVRPEAVERMVEGHGAVAVDVDQALTVEADVVSPCALGAVLDETSIPTLRARVVCGAANNQLATPEDGARLAAAGIVYVPDYVANAGGVINIAEEPGGYDRDRAWARIAGIADTVRTILATAEAEGITPAEAADRLVRRRLAEGLP
jgi:glutamate dehydrogenase/leucine dehydrogenase